MSAIVCPPCAACGVSPGADLWADRFAVIIVPGDWTDALRVKHREWNERVKAGEPPAEPPPAPQSTVLSLCPDHVVYVADPDTEAPPHWHPLLVPRRSPQVDE